MAKWTFEETVDAAMTVVAVIYTGKLIYSAYQAEQNARLLREADRFADQSIARMRAMHTYILQQRGSKAAYKEAFAAAKNRVQFEAIETLEGSPYTQHAIKKIHTFIDKLVEAHI